MARMALTFSGSKSTRRAVSPSSSGSTWSTAALARAYRLAWAPVTAPRSAWISTA